MTHQPATKGPPQGVCSASLDPSDGRLPTASARTLILTGRERFHRQELIKRKSDRLNDVVGGAPL
jgi:hypothetical protein